MKSGSASSHSKIGNFLIKLEKELDEDIVLRESPRGKVQMQIKNYENFPFD